MQTRNVVIIGHRGAPRVAPENTLLSFRKAKQQGAEGVEFDLQRCKSGEIVVLHDSTVNRTTNGKGNVNRLTLQKLKKFNAGKGQRIPTLGEAITFCKRLGLFMHWDIKDTGFEREAAAIVRKAKLYKRVRISAEHPATLRRIARLDPRIETGLALRAIPRNIISTARRLHVRALHVRIDVVTRKLLRDAHAAGMTVLAWTPLSTRVTAPFLKGALKPGIDELIVNRPDVAKKVLGSRFK